MSLSNLDNLSPPEVIAVNDAAARSAFNVSSDDAAKMASDEITERTLMGEDTPAAAPSSGKDLAHREGESTGIAASRSPALMEAAEWVKARLHYLAYLHLQLPEPPPPPTTYETLPPSATSEESFNGWLEKLRRRRLKTYGSSLVSDTGYEERLLQQYQQSLTEWRQDCNAKERGAKAEGDLVALPKTLRTLKTRLGLNEFEARLVLLCVAAEIEPTISPLCGAALQSTEGNDALSNFAFPTLAVARHCFRHDSAEAGDALSPHRPLSRLGLLTINQPDIRPLSLSGLGCHVRISGFLHAKSERDFSFTRYCRPLPVTDENALLASEQTALGEVTAALKKANIGLSAQKSDSKVSSSPVPNVAVALVGASAAGQQRIAARAAEMLIGTDADSSEAKAFCLTMADFPAHEEDREILLVVLERELLLAPFLLVLDAHSGDLPSAFTVRRLLELPGKILLLAPDAVPNLPVGEVVRLNPPTAQEQKEVWAGALKEGAKGYAPELARQFRLSADDIRAIAAKLPDLPTGRSLKAQIWDFCKVRTRPRMEGLAERIEPKADWRSLVLPNQERELLEQIAAQARARYAVYDEMNYAEHRSRGLGISALFHGESGTGKTLAAEVVAHELLLDLYRIDLSAVVDKYIGETEKNLRRLFDAAEEGGAVLFFDEADALFGKRGEVKDSHDRYANIEINYLLQRMESYTGLAFLATNRKNDLDKAFIRRLRFIVPFPLPEAKERAAIWKVALPEGIRDADPGEWTPGSPLDWEDKKDAAGKVIESGVFTRLSRLSVAGGVIQNIALGAMFRAGARDVSSSEGKPRKVNLYDIGESVREEFRKLERSLPESDLPPKREEEKRRKGERERGQDTLPNDPTTQQPNDPTTQTEMGGEI